MSDEIAHTYWPEAFANHLKQYGLPPYERVTRILTKPRDGAPAHEWIAPDDAEPIKNGETLTITFNSNGTI